LSDDGAVLDDLGLSPVAVIENGSKLPIWPRHLEKRRTMAGKLVNDVTDAEFEQQVLKNDQPVLVDFWAAWCGPCRALSPVMDEVAAQYNGQLKVVKMDVDRNNATAGRYGIRCIPALLLFKEGTLAEQFVGFVSKEKIDKAVTRILA
jgi:thioredoxin 1